MASGIKKLLKVATKNVQAEIARSARSGGEGRTGMYARGLASEGYNGGYRDALFDVLLALNGCKPSRNYWWDEKDVDNSQQVG